MWSVPTLICARGESAPDTHPLTCLAELALLVSPTCPSKGGLGSCVTATELTFSCCFVRGCVGVFLSPCCAVHTCTATKYPWQRHTNRSSERPTAMLACNKKRCVLSKALAHCMSTHRCRTPQVWLPTHSLRSSARDRYSLPLAASAVADSYFFAVTVLTACLMSFHVLRVRATIL